MRRGGRKVAWEYSDWLCDLEQVSSPPSGSGCLYLDDGRGGWTAMIFHVPFNFDILEL